MIYKVNEIFHSLQGEGFWTGTPMTFIRLSGCNLSCNFCDTEYETSMGMTEEEIFKEVRHTHICITGGEPTEQYLHPLLDLLGKHTLHIETNGTNPIPYEGVWITVSPKRSHLHADAFVADEMKFLCGKELPDWKELIMDIMPHTSTSTELYIMPIHGENTELNTKRAIQYVMDHATTFPMFKLTVQQHKLLGYK